MPSEPLNFKTPKNRPSRNSIDGFTPQRRSPLNGPQYYRNRSPLTGGPRRRLGDRQPLGTPAPSKDAEAVEDLPKLGDFDRPETNIFREHQTPQPEEGRKGRRAKKKKDKKEPGRLRGWWKNRSKKFKFGLISLIVLFIIGGLAGYRLLNFINSVFGRGVGNSNSAALSDNVDPSKLNTEGDGRLNILLLGRGGTENEAPDLTDTMMIASIDLQNQTTSLLSIPRDTYVGSLSDNTKINGVFARAKEQALYKNKKETVDQAEDAGIVAAIGVARQFAGVPIHKYVLTDYKAFRDVVNALGGVDINVPEAINDRFTGWKFKAGEQTMNGDRALMYARTRHGSARGDFDRNENQRQLIIAMRQKASSTGIVANPVRLNSLANAVQKNIRTDITLDEAKAIFGKTKAMPESSIKSLDLDQANNPLVTTGMANGQSIVKPSAGLQDYTDIKAFARNNMIDPFLRKEAPTVAVYNGSGKTGLATTVGNVLASYGYKVVIKETSKEPQSDTLVVRTNKDAKKPFTERFLSVRFSTGITSSLPSNVINFTTTTATTGGATTAANSTPSADYTIVLGANFYLPTSSPIW